MAKQERHEKFSEETDQKQFKHYHKFRETKIVGKDGKHVFECTTCYSFFDN